MLPFFPLYLAALHYTPVAIAILVSVLSLARIVAPPLVAMWLEAWPRCYNLPAILMLLAALAMTLLFIWPSSFYTVLLLLAVFAFVWAGILAPVDSFTARLGERIGNGFYAHIRLWGSIGFILTSIIAGELFSSDVLMLLPLVVALLMLLMGADSSQLFSSPVPQTSTASDQQLWPPALRRLMLAAFFMQCSHGAYYTFYSLHLQQLGFTHQAVGVMWTLGVVAEVLLMANFGRFPKRVSLALAMQLCFALTVLRWLGIAWSEAWWSLVLWQCLHAVSFAAFHVLSVTTANRLVAAPHQGRVQGWLAAAGFGAGGSLGVILAGIVVQLADISTAFVTSAMIAGCGMLLYSGFRESSK